MSKNFIELTKENLSSGKMNTGKIIKNNVVKIGKDTRVISNQQLSHSSNLKTDSLKNNPPRKKSEKNLFTIEPKYNENELLELSVDCYCGNHTRIVFEKEENLDIEEPTTESNEEIEEEPTTESNEEIEEEPTTESNEEIEEIAPSEN